MSAFLTPLLYRDSVREGFYILDAALIYESDLLNGRVIAVPGFETNFVTGRKLLVVRRIVTDQMNAAAVVHDQLYGTAACPRELADAVFYEAMRASEVAAWRALAAWAAVRLFGGRFFKA